jgi:predicted nucleic acid-binding protein
MEIRAVLDTNVMVAAEGAPNPQSPNREIVRRWLSGEFILLVSEDVLAEYGEKLMNRGVDPKEAAVFLAKVLLLAEEVEIRFFHLRHYPEDPDDVLFLLCALNGGASHLVSYDPHLLGLRVFYEEVLICPALEFLQALRAEPGGPEGI